MNTMSSQPPPSPSPATASTRRLKQTTSTWQKRRLKPKRLRSINFSEEAGARQSTRSRRGNVSDAYQFGLDRFLRDVSFLGQRGRPLPAVSTMLAIAPQQQQRTTGGSDSTYSKDCRHPAVEEASTVANIPLLGNFMDSLRNVLPQKNLKPKEGGGGSGGEKEDKQQQQQHDDHQSGIFVDRVSTVLTHGHHKRFGEMLAELERDGQYADDKMRKRKAFANARPRKKEFQKLCELFREERRLFSISLEEFKVDHAGRFLTGFRIPGPASAFVNVKSEHYEKWKTEWDDAIRKRIVSNTYGPYTQGISLQVNRKNALETIGIHTFQPKIVHRNIDSLPRLKSDWNESLMKKRQLKPHFITNSSSTPFISEDKIAKSLALEHAVDLVLTSDTLETLLKHPEDFNTRWSIPISYINVGKETLVLFMENPLPTSSTPKECLAVGTNEALISHAALQTTDGNLSSIKFENVYTLLTIPRLDGHRKVLVRSRNYLVNEAGKPTLIFPKLDYFSQYGLEEYTAHERAVWLLHKILQVDADIITERVDTTTMQLLSIEAKSIAEALTSSNTCMTEKYLETLGSFEIQEHSLESRYDIMMNILTSVSLIKKKSDLHHILCLPGRNLNSTSPSMFYVTVHSDQNNVNDVVVDVKKELEESATAVYLNETALMSCFGLWQWKHDRLPYTFSYNDHDKL